MTKLFTRHDIYHSHAILGVLSIIHIFYRFILAIIYGNAFIKNSIINDNILLLLHFFLHITSFQFTLPYNRNMNKPMIWNEFRFHSMIFTYRHLIFTVVKSHNIITILNYNNTFIQLFIVLITCYISDYATKLYGSYEIRTTNKMPYPEYYSNNRIIINKKFYSYAQFYATVWGAMGNMTTAFMPIVAIEIAPFLMTLVRKGKINSHVYHSVYRWCLLSNYIVIIRSIWVQTFEFNNLLIPVCGITFKLLRLDMKFNKYISWCIVFILKHYIDEYIGILYNLSYYNRYINLDNFIIIRMVKSILDIEYYNMIN